MLLNVAHRPAGLVASPQPGPAAGATLCDTRLIPSIAVALTLLAGLLHRGDPPDGAGVSKRYRHQKHDGR